MFRGELAKMGQSRSQFHPQNPPGRALTRLGPSLSLCRKEGSFSRIMYVGK